jgi:hypothetical protein
MFNAIEGPAGDESVDGNATAEIPDDPVRMTISM